MRLAFISLAIFLSSCSLFDRTPPDEEVSTSIETYNDLVKAGWKTTVVEGKIVLIKQTPNGLLVNDVFKVMADE